MIKRGTRKALRAAGTVLFAESAWWEWVDNRGRSDLVGGDLVMLTGERRRDDLKAVVVATGQTLWLPRWWLVESTSLVFDARG